MSVLAGLHLRSISSKTVARSRAEVVYFLAGPGLIIIGADKVNVEAKRGQDLGTGQNARTSNDKARALLAKYGEEQYRWLMILSTNDSRIRTRRVIRSIRGCSRRWAIAGKEDQVHTQLEKQEKVQEVYIEGGTAELESSVPVQP